VASPVLRQIAVFFSRLSASMLAGLSGEAKTAGLHDANICPLTLAYLRVSRCCSRDLHVMPQSVPWFPDTPGSYCAHTGCYGFYFASLQPTIF
jgi:hypothetical protein